MHRPWWLWCVVVACLLVVSPDRAVAADVFESWLRPAQPPADGFESFPVSPHASAGSEVRALARGQVVAVGQGGRSVTLEHLFHENHELRRVRSEYTGLEGVTWRPGQSVERGQGVGRVGAGGKREVRLLEGSRVLPDAEARRFTEARGRLPLPAEESVLLLISHAANELRMYERGREVRRVEVGFGQGEGRKRLRGDNRTPMGMYFVVDKHRGDFPGAYGAYYGGHWIRLNYPNPWDADWGVSQGVISRNVRDGIARAWRERKLTTASTKLGSGIGLHGWAGEWSLAESGGRLSWGCVVLHNPDITALYGRVPPGSMVVIF
ncbi:L,D-transpeptidase family protein [Archangium lansingense]|uniref:L,D-transpeptidase family protein n=1 Tax=Archangium lansingense TaxID=2995310 RepID=A0ABT4AMG3_9BACT|nr:L,D-transpeptidase family protein [Archangium lansinium]MCY1082876.1 L,D-transpeptidase family protein [Archangium lansinium]